MFEKFDDMLYGWHWEEDYTAAHEMRPHMVKMDDIPERDRELVLTRTKLEARTFFMRVSIGMLTGSWAGFLIALATGKIEINA